MRIEESGTRDLARLIIWYPVRWFLFLMPVSFRYWFFEFIGRLHLRFSKNKAKFIVKNFKRSEIGAGYPEQRFLIQFYQNHYVDRLQIICFRKFSKMKLSKLSNFLNVQNERMLMDVLEQKKGAIIVQPHYGPVQLPLFTLAKKEYRLVQVAHLQNEKLSYIGENVSFRLRKNYEGYLPAMMAQAKAFQRPLFDALKRNEVVFISGDGTGGAKQIGKHIAVPFLGQKIAIPLGPHTLSQKTQAPIILAILEREKCGSYTFKLKKVLLPTISEKEYLFEFSTMLTRAIEAEPGLWHYWDSFMPGRMIAK